MNNQTAITRLFSLVSKEAKKQFKQRKAWYLEQANQCTDIESLKKLSLEKGYIGKRDAAKLTTKKQVISFSVASIQAEIGRTMAKQQKHIEAVLSSPDFSSIRISVEWKTSRTWGANPTAEICVIGQGRYYGKASGCGYDKLSTSVAEALNQSNSVLKALYLAKAKKPNKTNRDLFGYGSGYGVLPSFEGGVGVSCYPSIFKAAGFKFTTTGSGKMFDSFYVEPLKASKN
jgi:hypothetical protein